MKTRLIKQLRRILFTQEALYILAITILFTGIVITNFPYGKWLLGWDNILPELNFGENFKRGFFSLWQENEGVGLTGGHGFATTLIHTSLVWLLSFVFPINYLRPIFHVLMLYIGTVGTFYLSKTLINDHKKGYIAFLSAVFYMINFGTIQMFYIPLEAFSAHFAFLPWLLWSLIRVLEKKSKTNYLIFAFISLLSTMQGFIPPLFIIYALFLGIILFTYIVKNFSEKSIKTASLIILITLAVNAYWLFPIGYYTVFNSKVYLNSYNNKMTTDEFITKNQKYGNIESLIQLKGFIYESMDTQENGTVEAIFQPWINHFNNDVITYLSYISFAVIGLGIFYALKEKQFYQLVFIILFLLCFTFLATDIFPLSVISHILRNYIPVFKQAFRIAFTKFAISTALMYSLFFGLGIKAITDFFYSKFKNNDSKIIGTLTALAILIILYFPIFQGNLFYKRIRLTLPDEYLNLFTYFQNQDPTGRIANFPQPIPTGWTIYKWGYSGSGFLWYGLPQPILDRNFDVWSNNNENYYWELSHAIYSNNPLLLQSVLQKYNIKWLLIDENVLSFTAYKALYIEQIEQLINQIPSITPVDTFGALHVYKVDSTNIKQNVAVDTVLPKIYPAYDWSQFDNAYISYGSYSTVNNVHDQISFIYFPFRSLFSNRGSNQNNYEITNNYDTIVLKTDLSSDLEGSTFIYPPYYDESFEEREKDDLEEVRLRDPQLYINYKNISPNSTSLQIRSPLELKIRKQDGYDTYDSKTNKDMFIGQEFYCNFSSPSESRTAQTQREDTRTSFIRLRAINGRTCRAIYLPQLSHQKGYIIGIKSRNNIGTPVRFWIENLTSKRAESEVYLGKNKDFTWEYFFIPPMARDGQGFTLHFDNIAYGDAEAENDIAEVFVQPFPFRWVSDIRFEKNYYRNNLTEVPVNFSERKNYVRYVTNFPMTKNQTYTVSLYQGYDDGWKAFILPSSANFVQRLFPSFFSTELKEHLKINNWANGWIVPKEISSQCEGQHCQVIIFYAPQYLQYIGLIFILLTVLTFVLVFLRSRNRGLHISPAIAVGEDSA